MNNTNSFGNNPVFIGARGDGNINKAIGLDGDIGEILVYNTVLDDANRKTVEDYLSKKWLPVDINNGLIAYYPLDGDETDKSPNKLDGAKQGTITYETGQQGKAARFNGSSSIKLSNVSGAYQKLSPSKISISLWAKYGQNDVSTTAGFILRNRTFGYEIAVNSTGLGGSFYVGTAGIGKSVANKFDAWRHIVITYDGTAMIFYLDGVPQEVIPATGNIYYGLNDAVMLGQDGTAGRFFKGLIDEVRIYDRAITEGEVKELYGQNLEKGLVAHYPFNGNAQDESGNNYHVQTNTATLTTDRFGKPNSAYRFNGTSNFMEVPHNTPFTTQNHTISAWIKTTKSSALGRIVVLPRPVGDQQFSLNVNSVRPKKACIYFDKAEGGGAVVAYNDKDVTDGEWHYLIGIIDQTNKKMSMYVDGILGDVINLVNTPVASTSFLQIGRFNAIQPENFDGDIDDIRIYDRAISQSEIEKLYGKPIDDINKGLIAHYPLNGDTKDVGPNKLDGEPKNIGNDDYVVGINGLKAAKFNGSSSAIILANITDASKYTLFSPKKFTLSAQFKDGTGTLIDWGYGGYELKVKKGTIANQIEIEGSVLVSGGRIRVNKAVKMHPFLFNHAALTFDGFNLILYFDGKPIGNIKMSNLIDLAYNPKDVVAIGKRENNNDFFKGLLQDVRFYDRALSDVEVNNLYYVPLEKRTVESIYPSICGKGDGISLTTAIKGKGFQQNQIVQLVSRDDNSKVINGIIKKITDNEIIVKWDIPETSKLGHYNLEVLNFSDGIKRTLNKAFEVQKLINDEPPFAALFGGELRCGVFTLTISNKSNVPIYAYNKGILVQALNEFSNIKVSSITRIEDFPRFSSNTLTKNQIEELNKLTTDFIVSEDKIEHKKNYALRLIIPKLNPLQKALQFRFKVTGGSPGEEYIAFKEENKHKIVDLNPSNLQNCSYCSQCYIDFGSFIPFVDRFACLGQAWCSVTNHIIAEDEAGNDTGFKNMGKQIQDGLWDCVSGEIIKEKVDKINNEYAKDIVTASEAVENIGNVVVDCDKCANSYVQYKNKVTVCSSTARQQVLGYEIADTSIINYNIVGNNGFKLEKYVKSGSPMPYIGNVQKSVSKNK